MRTFKQIPADKIGVVGWYMKGFEHQGILFMPPNEHHRAEALGAQCGHCHTIIWITGRDDPILNEKYPEKLPPSGPAARQYYQDNLKRFLASLPPCPNCGVQNYDLFINNVIFPRYESGAVSGSEIVENEEMSAKIKNKLIWWYGDEDEAKRLGL